MEIYIDCWTDKTAKKLPSCSVHWTLFRAVLCSPFILTLIFTVVLLVLGGVLTKFKRLLTCCWVECPEIRLDIRLLDKFHIFSHGKICWLSDMLGVSVFLRWGTWVCQEMQLKGIIKLDKSCTIKFYTLINARHTQNSQMYLTNTLMPSKRNGNPNQEIYKRMSSLLPNEAIYV